MTLVLSGDSDSDPARRPSGAVAQGASRMDAVRGLGAPLKGPGMALVSRPPEQHRSEGSLAAGQTLMPGWPSLWLLSLGQTRESNSPCKAKPVGGAEESVAGTPSGEPAAENKSVPSFCQATLLYGLANNLAAF